MSPRSRALAARLAADLEDLRELADIEPDTAEAIRCAVTAQLAVWARQSPASLTERVKAEG